jgi:hypothetical protein
MEYSFTIFCDLEKMIFENFKFFENNITYIELSKYKCNTQVDNPIENWVKIQ